MTNIAYHQHPVGTPAHKEHQIQRHFFRWRISKLIKSIFVCKYCKTLTETKIAKRFFLQIPALKNYWNLNVCPFSLSIYAVVQ